MVNEHIFLSTLKCRMDKIKDRAGTVNWELRI